MAIGKAMIKNPDQFFDWVQGDGKCWGYHSGVEGTLSLEFRKQNILSNLYEKEEIDSFLKMKTDNSRKAKEFLRLCQYADEFEIPFDLVVLEETYGIIRLGKNAYVIPKEYLDIREYTDYSELSLAEMKKLTGKETDLANPEEQITIKETKASLVEKEQQLQSMQEQRKELERQQKEELEKIKREIEAKYKEKQDLIRQAKEALDQQIEQLKNQLFVLDTELYAIQCFNGETITFTKLRSGRAAAIEEPVVLHQKIRYLDEELARMVSIYGIGEESTGLFEHYLQSCDYAAEFFAPGEKSISLIQLSRTGTTYVPSDKHKNMLEEYEIYHGNMIGILIRNGENVYIGWTDADRVNIEDENIYYTPGRKEYQYEEKAEEKIKAPKKEEVASRYFVYAILQGVIHQKSMLQIPKEEQFLSGNRKYILFNATEGLLEDSRFGLFSDIIKRCNVNIQKEDKILTIQYLRDEKNSRGRGYHDRTHDVRIQDATIYSVNLVEKETVPVITYEYPFHGEWHKSSIRKHTGCSLSDDVRNVREEERTYYTYYVSLPKMYSERDARANFAVEEDEFINLTFLNSVWVKYAIQNRKVGRLFIGGKEVSYAYAMRYLNTALEYLRNREKQEKELIMKYSYLLPEWEVALSEWKLKNNVHSITDYQAKRFAKYYTASQNEVSE